MDDHFMNPEDTVAKLKRQIKILKLKLIIARNAWDPKPENYGLAASVAATVARTKLLKMKLTKAEKKL